MKRFGLCILALSSLIFLISFQSSAQNEAMVKHSMRCQGLDREYFLYVPETLAEGAPLVVMLHGYGGSAENYRPEMLAVAQKHHFALCVPQGTKAPKGKTGWNVRYPKQEGMTVDDVKFVCRLAKKLQKEYGLSKLNTFLTGMSNGGEMCYLMAYGHPEFWGAIASVAGLTMEWLMKEQSPKGPVPFFEIHGTQDHTSEWGGDPENNGGWGAYTSVPVAVGAIVAANKCTYEETSELPLLDSEKPSRQVILHHYLGGTEVRLYEVVGGGHSWHLDDIDTLEEIWSFFESHMR